MKNISEIRKGENQAQNMYLQISTEREKKKKQKEVLNRREKIKYRKQHTIPK